MSPAVSIDITKVVIGGAVSSKMPDRVVDQRAGAGAGRASRSDGEWMGSRSCEYAEEDLPRARCLQRVRGSAGGRASGHHVVDEQQSTARETGAASIPITSSRALPGVKQTKARCGELTSDRRRQDLCVIETPLADTSCRGRHPRDGIDVWWALGHGCS